jgi:hypothetical protein
MKNQALGIHLPGRYPMVMPSIRTLFLVSLLALSLGWTAGVSACPGCKEALANEAEEQLDDESWTTAYFNPAHAYSYSVLFMLAVPALLLVGFGTAFYRLSRKAQQMRSQLPIDPSTGEDSTSAG